MARDRMQKQRFELKYLISSSVALQVRDFVQSYLEFDEYSVGKPNFAYPVHSVYLDSDDLKTYWSTINGDKNRFKLRMRFYSAHPDTPVFFEIKRRVNNCILKQRGGVKQKYIDFLLNGHYPEQEHLVSTKNQAHMVALQRFCELTMRLQAKPKIHIAYEREAYVNDTDTVRVTLDRNVRAEPNLDTSVKIDMNHDPVTSFNSKDMEVILELKFTDKFPSWFGALVRRFNVMQCGAAKYVESIQGLGHQRIAATTPVIGEGLRRMTMAYEEL
jgi:SPX domain protein involved in polyphosphate accumulation